MNCSTCGSANAPQATVCQSCGSPLHAENPAAVTGASDFYSPSLPAGTKLKDGAFAIGEVLGQGGFGITYKGGDLSLRRYVAIKEFFPHGCRRHNAAVAPTPPLDAASFEIARKGFIQEAMTLARFNHASIVRVFGVFEENNTAYMVMELLEGMSLQKRLDEKGIVPEKEALSIVEQVGAALEAVHAAKMLHRDIKPDNIVLTNDGRVVLIDFGTAREFAADKTRSMTAMVTHGYAPLEQYTKQARFGAFTDVYALGATLYHCLTGQLPASAMDRVAGVELPAPDRINPNLSYAVNRATMKALEVKASERFQSVSEFMGALKASAAAPANPIPAPSLPAPPASTGGWSSHGPATNPVSTGVATGIPSGVPAGVPVGVGPNQATFTSTSCPHCGKGMSAMMTTCPWCLKPRAGDVGFAPLHEQPDTLFDRVMFAVPNWLWRTLGVAVLLGILGRGALGAKRYQNGSQDFGDDLAARMMKQPEAFPLTKASLHPGPGVYDEATMKIQHNDYVGEVRYRDGDVGTLNLDVTSRDWLYQPEKFKFSFEPKDFGGLIGSQVLNETNRKLRDNDASRFMTSISLTRRTRTQYKGSWGSAARTDSERNIGGDVSAIVTSFNTDGSPATWTYSLD